ncbi:LacI family DNA-binding transcriptional regulator [Cereibacter sp. SYSU M97828]|nr:LacI family DNA-binding transcriptional regulator [Cereibacter flavus]
METSSLMRFHQRGHHVPAKTTAKDVAAAAGVSTATVDRVLNNRGGVAPEKERLVLEWARKLRLDRAMDQRASRTLRIAVAIQPPDNPFHAALQEAFNAAYRLYPQFNMQFRVHHISARSGKETARLISNAADDHDGIVIIAPQDDDVIASLRKFQAVGKPILTLATDIGGLSGHRYVGPDNRQAGRVAGDIMGRLLGKEGGRIIVVVGMLSMTGHAEREHGFRAVLKERYPNCHALPPIESFEIAERAGDMVFDLLRRDAGIRGIYNASAGVESVAAAMRALGRAETIFVTHELTEARQRLVKEGLIDVIIDQNPHLEAQICIATIASHFGRHQGSIPDAATGLRICMMENCEMSRFSEL